MQNDRELQRRKRDEQVNAPLTPSQCTIRERVAANAGVCMWCLLLLSAAPGW